jgi:hypothetical protein
MKGIILAGGQRHPSTIGRETTTARHQSSDLGGMWRDKIEDWLLKVDL